MNVYRNTTYSIQNVGKKKPIYPSTDEEINKLHYSHTVEYYYINKQWSINTCYNMDEPWKRYAKWKKPVPKNHILYDYIYMKFLEQPNLYRQTID